LVIGEILTVNATNFIQKVDLIMEGEGHTYEQINAESNRIADTLIKRGLGEESRVAWMVGQKKKCTAEASMAKLFATEMAEVARQIGQQVAELIPDGSTLQIGIGSIPDAVVQSLEGKRDLRFFAMGIDAIVDCVERGLVDKSLGTVQKPKIVMTEILGTKRLFAFVHENPLVEGRPILTTINSRVVGQIEKFISILGAIEVDLTGQVNAETVNRKQISAIGGSFDFLQGALFSPEGKSIIALTSTTPDGKVSRIVPQLPAGSAVTHPRHSVQYIVTEYGKADLRGKTLRERAEALTAVAHPAFREGLEKFGRENY